MLPDFLSCNLYWKVKMKVAQLCPTLCDPMGYTVHGILQARILEWVAFPFSGGLPQPMNWTQVSRIAGGFFTSRATREAQEYWNGQPILLLRIFLTQESTGISCIAGGFFTSLATREDFMCTWMEIFIQKHNKFYWFQGFGHLRRRCKYDHNNSPFCQFLFDFSLFDPAIFFKGHFSHHV